MLYLLTGDEYLVKQQLNVIKESARQKHGDSFVMQSFDAQTTSDKELTTACNNQSLFSSYTLVIITHLFDKALTDKMEAFVEFLLQQGDTLTNDVVLMQPGELKKSKLTTALRKLPHAQHYDTMTPAQVATLLVTYAQQQNALLPTTTASYLVSLTGPHIQMALQELDKLIAYADGKSIDKEMIQLLVPQESFDEIFPFLDAIATKNKALALHHFAQQVQKGEPELIILSSIIRTIRTLIHIRTLLDQQGPLIADELATTLGIHPYVAKKSLISAQNFTLQQLKNIFKYLQAIDRGIKNSLIDPATMIETMIVKI